MVACYLVDDRESKTCFLKEFSDFPLPEVLAIYFWLFKFDFFAEGLQKLNITKLIIQQPIATFISYFPQVKAYFKN